MLPRRDFLAWVGATLAASGVSRPLWAGALDPIGIQLYSLRGLMRQDVDRTLAAVAEIGYREVEFAGYFEHPPERIRAMLDAHGLRAPAAHIGFPELGDSWDRVLDASAQIGHRYVVTPWIAEERRTPDGYRQAAELFNRAGEAARARGLTFGYHNHDFEFARVGDRLGFDILLDETDPALVTFELDIFWITKGGYKPLDYFARYPGRFPMVHVKDMGADGSQVDVGAGQIDFPGIFARARKAGIRHYFVEHDEPADPLGFARRSHAYLHSL